MNISNKFQDYYLFIFIGIISTFVIFIYNQIFGFISLILLGFSIYHINYLINRQEEAENTLVERMDLLFDNISKNAIFSMPFAIMVMDEEGRLKWYNTEFKKLFNLDENLVDTKINYLLPEIDFNRFLNSSEPIDLELNGNYYHIYHNITESNGRRLILSYAIDNTEDELIRRAYDNESITIFKAIIDNYDEVKSQTPENQAPYLFAEIDRIINEYFVNVGGYVKKYENNKYIMVVENEALEKLKEDNFKILDYIMDLDLGNKLPATLSIGVGVSGANPDEKNDQADMALDMALGRGGEQVVIKDDDKFEFFGGRTQSTTKRNTVRSRVFAHSLSSLIDNASKVFVMGHKNPDMDSFGACLGIYSICKKKNKECKILLKEVTKPISRLYARAVREVSGLVNDVIKCPDANVDIKSLVIVVDNNRYLSVECEDVLKKAEKLVVIDHHRRGENNIKEATLSYIDPQASSASAMVTEMTEYMFENASLPQFIAEALLAGITVDTKNFNFQTSSRTFELASFLKRMGASSMRVKELFKDDFDTFKYVSRAVSRAEIYGGNIAISLFDEDIDNASLIASKAADELLNVDKIEASFVIVRIDDKTHISGRSLGNISVQIILEKLGGGGHLTSSATQMTEDVNQAKELLIKAIDEYLQEDIRKDESNIN